MSVNLAGADLQILIDLAEILCENPLKPEFLKNVRHYFKLKLSKSSECHAFLTAFDSKTQQKIIDTHKDLLSNIIIVLKTHKRKLETDSKEKIEN